MSTRSEEQERHYVLLVGGARFRSIPCDLGAFAMAANDPNLVYATKHADAEARAWHVVGCSATEAFFELCQGDCGAHAHLDS